MIGSRGGRPTIPGRLIGDPDNAGPQSEVAEWFDRAHGKSVPGPAGQKDPSQIVQIMPAPYWSVSVLRPGDARLVDGMYIAKYVNTNGVRTTIATGDLSESGRVLLMTHWGFFALAPGLGGTSTSGLPVELPDYGLFGFCEMSFDLASGGPVASHYFGFTGGIANQIAGSGRLNEWTRSVEIAIPARTNFNVNYTTYTSRTLSDLSTVTGPAIVPTYIGWRFEGWSISSEIWNRYSTGGKR